MASEVHVTSDFNTRQETVPLIELTWGTRPFKNCQSRLGQSMPFVLLSSRVRHDQHRGIGGLFVADSLRRRVGSALAAVLGMLMVANGLFYSAPAYAKNATGGAAQGRVPAQPSYPRFGFHA